MGLDPEGFRLDGKVAVVTGGGAGIGRGIANGLATFGAMVAIWERDPDTCASAAAEVDGLPVPTDVRDGAQVDTAVRATLAEYGTIDVLVNNAGGVFASSILDTSENGFDALYRANLRHVLLCTQRVARVMVDAGRGGSIVNVTSIEGVRAAPGYAAYAAAKAGVINLTKTASLELAPYAIRVNALAPDITMTEGLAALMTAGASASVSAGRPTWEHTVPLGRAGTVDDIAGAAVFLASSLSTYLTGQTLHVDGGTEAAGGWYHHPATGDYVLGPSSNGGSAEPTVDHGAEDDGAITSSP
jgi:NAD(P)-dependent dehydrogenase (short-subunit alcohol dehydrogenase family)